MLDHASCSAPGGPGGGPGPRGRSSAGAGAGDHRGAGQRDQLRYQDADSGRSLAQGVLDDAAGPEVATAPMTTLPLVCCSTQGRCRCRITRGRVHDSPPHGHLHQVQRLVDPG